MTQPAQNFKTVLVFKQKFSETIVVFSIQVPFQKANNIDFTILGNLVRCTVLLCLIKQ